MSGFEVVGLVLGGLSLVVSALEHYGTIGKLGRKWKRAHREHERDLGRLRDCELEYRLIVRKLLAPLQRDKTLDLVTVESLLASLDDDGWQTQNVDIAITQRLGESKERYLANWKEMNDTIVKLCKISMAADKDFQSSLAKNKKV
jgi:hypothetical protein